MSMMSMAFTFCMLQLYANNGDGVIEYKKLTNDKYAADTANNITDRIFKPRRAYLEVTQAYKHIQA